MRSITRTVKTTVVLAIVLMMTIDTANACRLLKLISRGDDASCGCESTVSMPVASAPVVSAPIFSAPIVSAPVVVESSPAVDSFPIVESFPIVDSAPVAESAPIYSEPVVAAPISDCCCCCSPGLVASAPVEVMDGRVVETGPVDDGYVESGFASEAVIDGGYADFPVVSDAPPIQESMPLQIMPDAAAAPVVEESYSVTPDATIIESPVETINPDGFSESTVTPIITESAEPSTDAIPSIDPPTETGTDLFEEACYDGFSRVASGRFWSCR